MNTDVEQHLIHTRPMMGRALINHDPRSKAYRAVVPDLMPPPKTKTWRRGLAYDQSLTPHCVAFTGKGILNTSRMSELWPYHKRAAFDTTKFYQGAQLADEWDGEAYDGTSGLGICRYLKAQGIINEYRWCFTLEDYLLALSHEGPVGFGTWWKSGMWRTTDAGYLDVSGSNEGGHEVELFGVNMEDEYVLGMNSWGRGWGDGGRFKLGFAALEALINENADGFVIVG